MLMKPMRPYKNLLIFLLIFPLAISASGCFYIVLGSVAAAGGYAVSRDTIQGETEREFDEIWEAAVEIVSILGTVESQSRNLGEIIALVNGARVTIHVIQLSPSMVRLRVKARKNIFPSIANAQNVFIKIMNKVNE